VDISYHIIIFWNHVHDSPVLDLPVLCKEQEMNRICGFMTLPRQGGVHSIESLTGKRAILQKNR
jgi:hypothetical protein